MNGLDQARETAAKIKEKSEEENAEKSKTTESAKSEIEAKGLELVEFNGIKMTAKMASLYRQTAGVGMQNILSNSLPQLKVVETKSKDTLNDGSKPPVGSLFYSPTKEMWVNPEVAIVTVSRGFYTRIVDKDGNPTTRPDGTKTRFNQLVGGVNLSTMQPFILFAAGIRWKPMNDFVKSVAPFTKHKQFPIPLYAFQVKLSTFEHESGNCAVQYDLIVRDGEQLQLTQNERIVEVLLASVEKLEDMMDNWIAANEVYKETGEPITKEVEEQPKSQPVSAPVADPEPSYDTTQVEDVSDDIPF